MLSCGGYGKVFRAFDNKYDEQVVIKIVQKKMSRMNKKHSIPYEVYLLKKLTSVEGVVKLRDFLKTRNKFIYIFNSCQDEVDFFEYMNMKNVLSEEEVKRHVRNLLNILIEVEAKGCYHCDLKEENILINLKTKELKLIDFGSGKYCGEPSYEIKDCNTTLIYAAPEYFMDESYRGGKFSVWQIGIIVYQLLHGYVPFTKVSDIIHSDFLIKNSDLSESVEKFLSICLKKSPLERPELSDLLLTEFLLKN